MISDVLANAVVEIDWYLHKPVYAEVYSGERLDRIVKIRDAMNELRTALDTPPDIYGRNP